jgi:anti-sigma28 factor (negative regulator of flagellin synthesis)
MSEPRLRRTAGAAKAAVRRSGAGGTETSFRELARRARVAQLARAVRNGTYRPDATAVAEAILRAIDAEPEPPRSC